MSKPPPHRARRLPRAVIGVGGGEFYHRPVQRDDPVERSWVAELAPERIRGSAFGLYHGTIGIAALPASLIFGAIYVAVGPGAAFLTGAGLAVLAVVLLGRTEQE